MPSRYVLRSFRAGGFYHVFNRGVEKRDIFLDEKDYWMFRYYLTIYLKPLAQVLQKYPDFPHRLQQKNLANEVQLLSYCLMPNHFHLLLRQKTTDGISKLLQRLTNGYTLYFNKKYDNRVGPLLQGRFKAAEITSQEQLLHLSRYIHLNPFVANMVKDVKDYQWSSYCEYVDRKKGLIQNIGIMLMDMSPIAYERFVLNHADYARSLEKAKHLLIEG